MERKGSSHRHRSLGWTLSIIGAIGPLALLFLGLPAAHAAAAPQPAGAEICFTCHFELKKKFSQGHVHTPVKMGACPSCHNPHAAKFPKLLRRKGAELCYGCHTKEKEAFQQQTVHRPVKDGDCTACHDPHAGPEQFQLAKAGGELCLTCHSALKEKPKKFTHYPFEAGTCLLCHNPHASQEHALLNGATANLCQSCHNLQDPRIRRAHSPFSMEKAACERCHNPHGSDNKALIKTFEHPPFAQGRCGNCHQVSGPDPRKTLLSGKDLCLTCHAGMVEELKKKLVHPPVAGGQCTACHSPHASELKGLLAGKERTLCLGCHKEVAERFQAARSFHPEKAADGRCTACHRPHSSDRSELFDAGPLTVCGACHKAHAALSHPMGSGIIDPRTNQPVTCLSCHDPHGTSYDRFLRFSQKRELCLQCHKKFR